MDIDPGSVLVLDTDGQAGLAVVRSLGRRGVPVVAGSAARVSLGRLSRRSTGAVRYPDPTESASRFLDRLVDHIRRKDYDIVVPVRDSTSALLSRRKETVEAAGTTVAVEDWETFERAYDKGRLCALAASLDVPVPETFDPSSLADVSAFADDVPYPAVVKPRSKTVWDDSGRCHHTLVDDSLYVESPAELRETYRDLLDEHPVFEAQDHYPIVQEYVEGETTTTVGVANDGELETHFQEERLRTYPSSGGASTLLRERHDPEALESARTLLGALEWTGPAMVEYMRTPEGEHYLIEVNGRYWGSVPFAIRSGIDIPWQHYRLLHGEGIEHPDDRPPSDLHHRLLYGDLKWLDEQLRAGNPTAPLRVLRACLVADQASISLRDPKPTAWALGRGLSLAGQAGLERLFDAEPDERPSTIGEAVEHAVEEALRERAEAAAEE